MRILNPATEEVVADVPETSGDDAEEAVERARAAAKEWARLPPADRARLLSRFASAVDGAREELAQLEVLEAGHPITSALWEAGHVRDVLAYYAAAPERLAGQQIPVAGGLDVTFHEPLGVVGVIVPWNFPMTIAAWGFAPALAAGNAVLLKPAEATPLTALRLASLALSAGLPAGLLQVLPGLGPVTGSYLVRHPAVRKICFTGSVPVGQSIMTACASAVKRVTLELGGKSANIVFADADVDAAADAAPMAVFDNAGQDCCARSRILVQASVYERFMARFESAVKSVVVGSPLESATQMGPLISAAHRDRVAGYVSSSVAFRGSCPAGAGFWFPPTVLAGPAVFELPAWREEVFGPVVCVTPFSSEADAIAIANDTPYGLSGSIWTRDVGRAIRVARAVESGNLSVNSHSSVRYSTPFGGFKSSGLGRELGPDAALEFTETKNVFIAVPDPSDGPSLGLLPQRWAIAGVTKSGGNRMRLDGRTAVVTGAGSGIGLATVHRLAAEGARVVAVDIDAEAGEKAALDAGGIFVPADVADESDVERVYRLAFEAFGSVDIAFNNAGISPPEDDSIIDTDLEAWRRVQEVNLTSVYLCCRAALPYMRRQGRGSIINTASFVAVMGSATSQISYTASKGGVLALSRELGVQFAREGIRVNALCPGPVNTPLLAELFAADPERAARRLVHVPMGRFAEASEIAAAVAFLASDDSSFITASTFLVDGGISGAYVTPV